MKKYFCLSILFCLSYISYSQTYEYAPGKYLPIKYTSKVDTVMITQPLNEGNNEIMKMKSGNTMNATVQKGKIVALFFTDSKKKKINKSIIQDNNAAERRLVCLNCRNVCYPEVDENGNRTGGPSVCMRECEQVSCDSQHNAIMWVDKKRQN